MYISKYTNFIAHDKPLTNVVYVKYGNHTVCRIYIKDNWEMLGEIDDFLMCPVGGGKLNHLEQDDCELILLKNMPPASRKKTLKSYGLDRYDSAEIMYRTRGINLLDDFWLAWSENDKAEDYHPLHNKKILEERTKDMIKFTDDEPNPPWSWDLESCIETRKAAEDYQKQIELKRQYNKYDIDSILIDNGMSKLK